MQQRSLNTTVRLIQLWSWCSSEYVLLHADADAFPNPFQRPSTVELDGLVGLLLFVVFFALEPSRSLRPVPSFVRTDHPKHDQFPWSQENLSYREITINIPHMSVLITLDTTNSRGRRRTYLTEK